MWREGALTSEIAIATGTSRNSVMRRSLTLRLGIHPKATNKQRMNAKTKDALLQMHEERQTIRHMSKVTGFHEATICRFFKITFGQPRGREVAERSLSIPDVVLLDRDRRYMVAPRDLTSMLMGDPLPGMSALDRR